MSRKMTRRDLAAVLGSAAAVAAARAQNAPANPPDLNAAAKDQLRQNAETMAKVELPMSTEPSFSFKA